MKSIYKFAKDNGLPRSSVHAKAQSLGMETSNGLSDDDQEVLLREFGKTPVMESPSSMVLRPPSSICPEIVDPAEVTGLDLQTQKQYNQYMTGVTASTQQRIGQLQHNLMAHAQATFAQVYADIDMTAATLRANALNAVQVNLQGDAK